MAFHKSWNHLTCNSGHRRQLFTSCLSIYILVTCLVCPLILASSIPDKISKEEIMSIEQFAGDAMSCANIFGLSLGIVRGDDSYSTGLGLADMHTGHGAGKHTVFNIGATSKAFLPFLLAELMNDPKFRDRRRPITWDQSLGRLLGYSDVELDKFWSDMTLKQMLMCKSGTSAADLVTMVGLPPHIDREGLIRRLKFLPASPQFKESYHYSNHLYAVVSHILERKTGSSWQDLMKTKVFSKLGMTSASFSPGALKQEDTALPYKFHSWDVDPSFSPLNKTLFDIHPSDPVGSVMVSADDMNKWMSALLKSLRNKGGDSRIDSSVRDAFAKSITVPANLKTEHMKHDSQTAEGYGMGWLTSSYRGFQRYKYSGQLYSYSSQVWLFPEFNSGVFLSINGPDSETALRAMDGILFHASDVLLRQEPWVSSSIACCCQDDDYSNDEEYDSYEYDYDGDKNSAPAETRLVKYLMNTDNYVGQYGNNLVGNLEVKSNKAGIVNMKLGRNLEGELLPGELASILMLHTKGALEMTSEWGSAAKPIDFLYTTTDEGGAFDKVQITLSDGLVYDFERGKSFKPLSLLEQLNAELEKYKAYHRKNGQGGEDVDDSDKEHVTTWQDRLRNKVTQPTVLSTTETTTTTSTTTTSTTTTTTTTPTTTTTTPTTTTTTTPTTTTKLTTTTTTTPTTTSTTTTTTTPTTTTPTTTTTTTTTTTPTPTTASTTTTSKSSPPPKTKPTTTPTPPAKVMKKEDNKDEEPKTQPASNSQNKHEILLQKDGDKSVSEKSGNVNKDNSYMVDNKEEFQGTSTKLKKQESRTPSRGRLIREDSDGNSALGTHHISAVPLLLQLSLLILLAIFWRRIFLS